MKVGKSMQGKIKSERTYIWNLESSQSTNTGGFFINIGYLVAFYFRISDV